MHGVSNGQGRGHALAVGSRVVRHGEARECELEQVAGFCKEGSSRKWVFLFFGFFFCLFGFFLFSENTHVSEK